MNIYIAFLEWLTPSGIAFFRSIMDEDGVIALVIPSGIPGVPHPVHFREGMQVRNWMRMHTDMTEDYIENHWRDFVVGCLVLDEVNG
ncbi:hypothetical protein vBRpoSV10_201 [Ruegeria phage vB_RpoS-V10]|nr:hypothetical protein DSS3P8_196 [Roseobacter phage DSS3P8]AWY09323.1 hypothetical protein vBRpoSV10_201 [Ruegeria phage vB_RpoS-V10]